MSLGSIVFASGVQFPKFGIGTWPMGSSASDRKREVDAIRLAMEHGVRLIDTAEMYANGESERVVSEAIQGKRSDVFITTKVLPSNASYQGTLDACEQSLRNLKTDYVDLYLLHWVGPHPIASTLEAFEQLKAQGKIREYGVSNFDIDDLQNLPKGNAIATNQIYYNLNVRAAEWSVIPWSRENNVPVMAYSPLDKQGHFLESKSLLEVAKKHNATAAQVAIAWLYQQEWIVPIPKSSNPKRVVENIEATKLVFDAEDWQVLGEAFPPPNGPQALPTT